VLSGTRKALARDDDPARELDEREVDQVLLQRFDVAENKEESGAESMSSMGFMGVMTFIA
jgi:hypothetical protein